MTYSLPTGADVLSKEEKEHVNPKLLSFTYTLATIFTYEDKESGLGKDLSKWYLGNGMDDLTAITNITDMLYCGLHDPNNPSAGLTREQISQLITKRDAPYVNAMMARVINKSTPPNEGDAPKGTSLEKK